MSTETHRPRTRLQVGLIGLPSAAGPLRAANLEVITAGDFADAVVGVTHALAVSPRPFPVIVETADVPGWRASVDELATQSRVVVAMNPATTITEPREQVTRIQVPCTLAQLLTACGAPPQVVQPQFHEIPIEPTSARTAESGPPDHAPTATSAPAQGWQPAEQHAGSPPRRGGEAEQAPAPSAPYAAPGLHLGAPTPPAAHPGTNGVPPAARPGTGTNGHAPPPQTGPDLDLQRMLSEQGPRPRKAQVVVSFGGRGGPGKSTFAQALAATAAERGIATVLVDANVGQGDQLMLLGSQAALPSIYDAATTGDPLRAFVRPEMLNATRGGRSPIHYALVPAPPRELAADPMITWGVYRAVIDEAAKYAQLIVVDTQILEANDLSRLKGDLVFPLLRAGAWGFGVSDASNVGLIHLFNILKEMLAAGIPRDRLMTVLNKKPDDVLVDEQLIQRTIGARSQFLGSAPVDSRIIGHSNAGEQLVRIPAIAHYVELALQRVCGLPVETGPPPTTLTQPQRGSRAAANQAPAGQPGFWRRLFGRRGGRA